MIGLSHIYSSEADFDDSDRLDPSISDNETLEILKIGLWKKSKIMIFGSTYLHDIRPSKGSNPISYYLFKCPFHGIQKSYPHGWKRYLVCPICMSEIT